MYNGIAFTMGRELDQREQSSHQQLSIVSAWVNPGLGTAEAIATD